MDTAERLWAIEQIKQLKARYFRYLDTKNWEGYRSLFTDDCKFWLGPGVNDPEPVHDNPDTLVQYVISMLGGQVISVHHGHMPEIEITSETTASGVWSLYDWVDKFGDRAFKGYGHYYEDYEKGSDGRWRIKKFKLTRLRVDDLPPSPIPV